MNIQKCERLGGFTLVEIMIVVAIIGLLAGIAIPSVMKARTNSQRNACISNLRVIDGAKEQWAFANKKQSGARSSKSGVNAYIKGGVTPKCPGAGSYRYGSVGIEPACTVELHALSTILALGEEDDEE